MSNNNNTRYKENRELRDREIQTQTQGYVSRFEPLLYVPAFIQKDFHYVHTESSIKGRPLRNYNSTPEVHNSSLKQIPLHKRWALSQSKEKDYKLVIQ